MGYGKEEPRRPGSSPLGALSRPSSSPSADVEAAFDDLENYGSLGEDGDAVADDAYEADDAYDGDDAGDDDADYDDAEGSGSFDASGSDPSSSRQTTRRTRARTRNQPSGLALGQPVGALIALGGAGLAAAAAADPGLRTTLDSYGVAPLTLVVLGVAMAYLSGLTRRVRRQEAELSALSESTEFVASQTEATGAQVGYLVDHGPAGDSSAGTGGSQDVQKMLHLIQRQEEKISNLSKATKMYGKPLLEITNQIGESSRQIAEIESKLNAIKVIVEQSTNRMESSVRDGLARAGAGGAGDGGATGLSADALQRLESMQRDMVQRLVGNSDELGSEVREVVRKSLRLIEEVRDDLSSELSKESERLAKELSAVGEHLEQARASILEELQRAGAAAGGQTGGAALSDAALDGITQQLEGLSRTLATMQTSIGQGSGEASAATADSKPAGGAGGSGSGVMSAIERLKQLRK